MLDLRGVIPPMITPLTDDLSVDVDSTKRLADFMIERGADAVFLLGSMSEGPLLPDAETARLVDTVVGHVNGRVPVLVGAPETSLVRAVPKAKQAQAAGADGVVLIQPYYFPNQPQEALYEYYVTVAEAVDVPLIVYNLPTTTQNPISLDTMARLAAHSKIVAVKDSSGNLRYMMELLRIRDRVDGFRVFIGEEWGVAPAVLAGADGTVAGIGSLGSKLLKSIYDAATAGDASEAMRLQNVLIDLFHGVYGPDARYWLAGHKEALAHLGIIESAATLVHQRISSAERIEIHATVDALREYLV